MQTFHGYKPGKGSALHLWTARDGHGDEMIIGAGDVHVTRVADDHTRGVDAHEVAHRVVSCVNACEGVAEPVVTLKEVRDVLDLCAEILQRIYQTRAERDVFDRVVRLQSALDPKLGRP